MTPIPLPRRAIRPALLALSLAASPVTAENGPDAAAARFWPDWIAFWNGELDRADALVADAIALHTVLLDGNDPAAIDGPRAFAGWIAALRQPFPDLVFETVAGPIVGPAAGFAPGAGEAAGDLLVAGHWRASGTYAGGLPGAAAAPGTRASFTGTDLVRLRDGQAAEYWLVSDTLSLLGQLAVGN